MAMRAVFGVVGLLVVVAVVGWVAKKQLESARAISVVPATAQDAAGAPVREQSQQLQRQVAEDVAKALSQGAARASEP
jgi:hypothetical protein